MSLATGSNSNIMMIDLRDRLIVALDFPSTDKAYEIIDDLGDLVSFYKIGLQLFPLGGVKLAHDLAADGKKTFLDFKFFDIGNTVKNAVQSVTTFGGTFVTVYGDRDIVAAAVKGRGDHPLKILAVTVLTSMNEESLAELGFQGSVEDLVIKRARIAIEAKCDGVIAAAQEAAEPMTYSEPALTFSMPGRRMIIAPTRPSMRPTTRGVRTASPRMSTANTLANSGEVNPSALTCASGTSPRLVK